MSFFAQVVALNGKDLDHFVMQNNLLAVLCQSSDLKGEDCFTVFSTV